MSTLYGWKRGRKQALYCCQYININVQILLQIGTTLLTVINNDQL